MLPRQVIQAPEFPTWRAFQGFDVVASAAFHGGLGFSAPGKLFQMKMIQSRLRIERVYVVVPLPSSGRYNFSLLGEMRLLYG